MRMRIRLLLTRRTFFRKRRPYSDAVQQSATPIPKDGVLIIPTAGTIPVDDVLDPMSIAASAATLLCPERTLQ
jgi:hypothetical protein